MAQPWLPLGRSRSFLALAPMEGISDVVVRELLSSLGGMDLAVTEFIRVAQQPVSSQVLLRACPELKRGGRTRSGVPVFVQLLGGAPELVAESARRAVALGALGIDLNFGCPARRVNGHDGGAAILKTPSRLTAIIAATRAACPPSVPVSAKIRLGWDNPKDGVPLTCAAEAGGADWITIHGRTKVQMYKPSADWVQIREAQQAVKIPVIANGDIFGPKEFHRCQETTGAQAFMLGRGAFRTPNLFRWIRGWDDAPWSTSQSIALLRVFVEHVRRDMSARDPERVALNRLKSWTRAIGERDHLLCEIFQTLKRTQNLDDALSILNHTQESFPHIHRPPLCSHTTRPERPSSAHIHAP